MERLINMNDYPVSVVLPKLLRDQTTGRNIIWATDTYAEENGPTYSDKNTIESELISGVLADMIQPRISKSLAEQATRTKKKAEVFTPAWICCKMNDAADAEWFGRENVFFTMQETEWTPVAEKIGFPDGKDWKEYILSRRLEITCGEAPFLVSRYDAATGERIPIERRVGLLDRKLRIVNENTTTEEEWFEWTRKAFESTYGYEYQGDNLLIGRINLLCTFTEYLENRWHRKATTKELTGITHILYWNLWQMDGLNDVVPLGKPGTETAQMSFSDLLGAEPTERMDTDCKIYDWRSKKSVRFEALKGRRTGMKFDFVIGNPPYQEEVEGNGRKTPIYDRFMDESYQVSDVVELIHPARFLFNAGQTPKAWNEKMLNDKHLKVLYYEDDAQKIFPGTEIKGGVAITEHNRQKEYGAIEVFTPFMLLNTILSSVRKRNLQNNMEDSVSSQGIYKFSSLAMEKYPMIQKVNGRGTGAKIVSKTVEKLPEIFKEQPKNNDDIRLLARINNCRKYRYIAKDLIQKSDITMSYLSTYNVAFPEANGSGTFGEALTLPEIIGPNEGTSDTYLSVGFLIIDRKRRI